MWCPIFANKLFASLIFVLWGSLLFGIYCFAEWWLVIVILQSLCPLPAPWVFLDMQKLPPTAAWPRLTRLLAAFFRSHCRVRRCVRALRAWPPSVHLSATSIELGLHGSTLSYSTVDMLLTFFFVPFYLFVFCFTKTVQGGSLGRRSAHERLGIWRISFG